MSLLTEDDILPALEMLMAVRREASDNHTNPKMQAYYGALATGVGTAIQEIRRLAEEKRKAGGLVKTEAVNISKGTAETMAIRVSDAQQALLSLLSKLERAVGENAYQVKTLIAISRAKSAHLDYVVDMLRGVKPNSERSG